MQFKTTNRRTLLRMGAGLAVAAPMLSPMGALAATKTLKVGHIEAPNSATHKAYETFAKLVEERTQGSVKVEIYPSGQLGNLRDLFEGLRFGSVEMTSSGPDYVSNLVPVVVAASLYYLWRDEDHARKALQGDLGSVFNDALIQKAQIRALAWGNLGFRNVFTTTKAIETPEDMKGLKVRVPEAALHLVPMKALGALPVAIPYSEVYTSLQTGIAQAAEATPAATTQQKFNEVSKFYSLTQHLFNPLMVSISERFYQSLSAQEQEAVTESCREAWTAEWDAADQDNTTALQAMRDGQVAVNEVDTAPFAKIAEGTWGQLIDPLGDEAWAIVKKFQAIA